MFNIEWTNKIGEPYNRRCRIPPILASFPYAMLFACVCKFTYGQPKFSPQLLASPLFRINKEVTSIVEVLCESVRRPGRKCRFRVRFNRLLPFIQWPSGTEFIVFVPCQDSIRSAIDANMWIRTIFCVITVFAATCAVNCEKVSNRLIVVHRLQKISTLSQTVHE